ncbi:hypothetical protein HGR_01437 [Hylemonella gracilis ATCC 19624]|uniref:Uncharacterized protein n=1 Tax=Hylemonella gracilis ATCC 19624 TaxID=887062 RepID=F3KPD0_9BURK|nr:hypothetical protein HGR_01437 [Hylemonella gracilis ATCC 19624]
MRGALTVPATEAEAVWGLGIEVGIGVGVEVVCFCVPPATPCAWSVPAAQRQAAMASRHGGVTGRGGKLEYDRNDNSGTDNEKNGESGQRNTANGRPPIVDGNRPHRQSPGQI